MLKDNIFPFPTQPRHNAAARPLDAQIYLSIRWICCAEPRNCFFEMQARASSIRAQLMLSWGSHFIENFIKMKTVINGTTGRERCSIGVAFFPSFLPYSFFPAFLFFLICESLLISFLVLLAFWPVYPLIPSPPSSLFLSLYLLCHSCPLVLLFYPSFFIVYLSPGPCFLSFGFLPASRLFLSQSPVYCVGACFGSSHCCPQSQLTDIPFTVSHDSSVPVCTIASLCPLFILSYIVILHT